MAKAQGNNISDLFDICDTKGRGYLTATDLTMICELPPENLQEVFNQLDSDKDGIVTRADFEKGFANILGGQAVDPVQAKARRASLITGDTYGETASGIDLKKLEALPCQDELLTLYSKLQTTGVPELLSQFEKVIAGVVKEVKEQRDMNEQLQQAYSRDKDMYSKQMEEVETEIDSQIQAAEERARQQEREKLEKEKIEMKKTMETEMFELQSNIKRLQKMENILNENGEKSDKVENMKERMQATLEENRRLKSNLTSAHTNMALVKAEFVQVRNEYEQRWNEMQNEREYLTAAMQEQESLARQLQLLQDANMKLHDTNDSLRSSLESRQALQRRFNLRSPSPQNGTGSYTGGLSRHDSFSSLNSGHASAPDYPGRQGMMRPLSLNVTPGAAAAGGFQSESDRDSGMAASGIEDDVRSPYYPYAMGQPAMDEYGYAVEERVMSPDSLLTPRGSLRLGESATNSDEERDRQKELRDRKRRERRRSTLKEKNSSLDATGPPERTFRVVMAGDASVGKSSFIMRLCKGRFEESLPSTLGVDFHVKTMNIHGKNVALQLWDTAGQERFRSLCKSYFRRSDGAIMMYDCTCEQSFLNVRNWMDVIRENAPRSIPVLICANKIDARIAAVAEGKPVIETETGQTLAKTYGVQFVEVSAKDGTNISAAVTELGRELLVYEDIEVKSCSVVLHPGETKSSSGCCGNLRN